MNARRIGWAIGLVTLAYSGAYVFVYLYRWEWNRALTAGLFFLAAEIGLVAAFLAERIRKLERRIEGAPKPGDPVFTQVRARPAESPAPPRDHFAWLRSSMGRTNVFIPVLMGAGVILSGLAWVVERVARATAGSAREHKLAGELLPISLPADPIVRDADPARDNPVLALLLSPRDPAVS